MMAELPTRNRLGSLVAWMTDWSARWVPGAFSIACLLTLFTFAMVVGVARKTPAEALDYWTKGFWQLLELSMQMSLILLTGYMVAVSPPASRLLNFLAGLPSTTTGAIVLMAFVSMLLSWLHWGLGLIGGPIFLGFLMRKHPQADYRLAVAAGYLGTTCTWHVGLSGSAPLLMATPKHFMESQIGIIPMSATTFSSFNLVLTVVIVLVICATVRLLDPGKQAQAETPATPARHDVESASQHFLESTYWLNLVMGLVGLAGLAVVSRNGFQLSLNVFNFTFLFLALFLHPNPASFTKAAAQGAEYLHGIIIQYPFYAGMYGLINFSGLAVIIGGWFVSFANPKTFPVIVYWYSGILSYFIPSGGSKWVVEAPYILAAAKSLGVPVPQTIVAYAWGDMSTHFLQPFWAIPMLSIARLEFKDILGYLVIFFAVNGLVVSAAFMLMPFVWP